MKSSILNPQITVSMRTFAVFGLMLWGFIHSNDASAMGCMSGISISQSQQLRFGSFAVSSSGNVIVSTNGTRSSTGGVFLAGGTYTEARFQVSGSSNCTYSISLPSSVSISSGGNSMTVNSFTKNPTTGTLNSSGNQTLYIGATLQAGSSQSAGSYNGFFTVTVNYN